MSANRLLNALRHPVDAASLAAFRILFGALLFLAILRFFIHGWIHQLYIEPQVFFSFYGFSWLHPWPAWGMYLHFVILGLLALGITAGYYYRFCAVLFFLGFSYIELLDVTNYLNHYYLLGLISFLMIFLPANRIWSLDKKVFQGDVPLLSLWVLRAQLTLVYFYAGVGKLQADWLFAAQPLRVWLGARSDLPWIGSWLQEPWVAYAMSWSGAVYDLSIPFWLIWSRSRPWAFAAVVAFHVATAVLFPMLGMFPLMMIAFSLIFFPPDWPRTLGRRFLPIQKFTDHDSPQIPSRISPWATIGLILFFAWQILWPLRHWAYPGNNLWTEEAYRFSWNVMLMEKSGHTEFFVKRSSSGQLKPVETQSWLTPLQRRMMSTQPDLILQTAQQIAKRMEKEKGEKVAVYAEAMVSLNGRPPFPLVDPKTNLAAQTDSFRAKSWILPLR